MNLITISPTNKHLRYPIAEGEQTAGLPQTYSNVHVLCYERGICEGAESNDSIVQ